MIISHEHRFIFIKVPRTASTSVEMYLAPHCGERDIITKDPRPIRKKYGKVGQNFHGFFNPVPDLLREGITQAPRVLARFFVGMKYHNHISPVIIKNRVGKGIWDSYFKFCFERNPWDLVVSAYCLSRGRVEEVDKVDFSEFVKGLVHRRDPTCRMPDPMYLVDGNVSVDFIGRYEYLGDDLRTACDNIGLEVGKDIDLPRTNYEARQHARPYQSYYDNETRELVRRRFAFTIERMGYTFDG